MILVPYINSDPFSHQVLVIDLKYRLLKKIDPQNELLKYFIKPPLDDEVVKADNLIAEEHKEEFFKRFFSGGSGKERLLSSLEKYNEALDQAITDIIH